MPHMLPAPDFGQLHQQHMAFHHASMQSALQAQQNMLQTMQGRTSLMPSSPQPRLQYAQPQHIHQPRIEHQQPHLALPPAQQEQMPLIAYGPPSQEYDPQRDDEWKQEALTEARKIDARVHRLEDSESRAREREEAKDRELAASRLREQQLNKQLLEAEQRHNREIAGMAQSQAAALPPAGSSFDVSALRKIIAEVQTDRISKADIKQLVEDAVSKQLSGTYIDGAIASPRYE